MRVTVESGGERVVIEPGGQQWDGLGGAQRLIKSDSARRYTLGVAYPANRPDVGIARDGHRDFAQPDALEEAAWNYMKEHRLVGAWHEDGTEGSGELVESYVWPSSAPDWPQPDGYVVKAGDWLMGIIWDPKSWEDIQAGRMRGLSPQGTARRRVPTRRTTAGLRS